MEDMKANEEHAENTNENKKEKDNKEEKNNNEEKKDEPKVEEKKENEKPKEEPPKKEEKFPPEPKEPEPKIPTNFSNILTESLEFKKQGNELINSNIDEAIEKYESAVKLLEPVITKANKEKEYNPQSQEVITIYKQIMSNLSLCYFKKEDYIKSKELDIKIISFDPYYDKCYARLFNTCLKLNQPEHAVYFGDILLKKFTPETLEKYKDIVPKIEEETKKLQNKYDEIKRKERNEFIKSIAKWVIPLIVLIAAAFCYYYFIYLKKHPEGLFGGFDNNSTNATNKTEKLNFTLDDDPDKK